LEIKQIGIMETTLNSLEKLTKLQEELGYVKGEISTVAMLGLVGEAGEVLAETSPSVKESVFARNILSAIENAKTIDNMKKRVRNDTMSYGEIMVSPNNFKLFDAELADCFYYLNILATNRGLTINDLAQMAHDKIRTKQAQGGSSEDKPKP
jgi:hypothetical protein